MSDAWIYAPGPEHAAQPARLLAELGYVPRRLEVNGSVRPDGGGSRRPALALVVASGAPPEAAAECVTRLREDEALEELPIVLALEPSQLPAGPEVLDAHELIVTPFCADELRTRIARARRRAHAALDGDVLTVGSLELNLATYQVQIGGEPVDFAYMEYELLKFLVTHPGRVFSREALLNRVWGYDYYGGARTVDVHVRRVRAKLGSEHGRIRTVRNVGYRFDDD
jgi:two-component system, OmpR family, alkaline phosphatase synthesis response regulator PhoP